LEKFLAACGIDCSDCDARIATLANDDTKRASVAVNWADEYGAGLKAADINCTGCMEPGVLFIHSRKCDIRACVLEKGLSNCAECPDFACDIITQFMNEVPPSLKNLEELRESH